MASMPVRLNHTIVSSSDPEKSAACLARVLGVAGPERFAHFVTVALANEVTLDYAQSTEVRTQHFPDPDGHDLEVLTRPYGSARS